MPDEDKREAAATEPSSEPSPLIKLVSERLGAMVIAHRSFRGDDRIQVARENIVETCRILRDTPELSFDLLLDVTAIDYLGQPDEFQMKLEVWDENRAAMRRIPQYRHRIVPPPRGPEPRFAVVYHMISTKYLHRLRIKCRVPEDDPKIPSVTPIWRGANWLERETYDLYGIVFSEHPDLRRIYLYEEFEGHPLRKDYGKWDEQPIQPLIGPGAHLPRRPVIRPGGEDPRAPVIPQPDKPRTSD
jgi:NADH-quinone oxidoreductase subunit C